LSIIPASHGSLTIQSISQGGNGPKSCDKLIDLIIRDHAQAAILVDIMSAAELNELAADPTHGFQGWLPLQVAVLLDRHQLCEKLIQKGADPAKQNRIGHSPLDTAGQKGNKALIDLFKRPVGPP
jgi:ankyrin repeat protein